MRLRGWKSIAAYLKVNESTAVRWSKRQGFPVIRTGDGGSVFATSSALDAWLAEMGPDAAQAEGSSHDRGEPEADVATVPRSGQEKSRRWLLTGAVVGVVAALGSGTVIVLSRARGTGVVGPIRDAELEALYLDARADWASRVPERLVLSIDKFKRIIASYPDFVPGFTGLADAQILSCEFNSAGRDQAFHRARAAVSTALALEPKDPDANRIMGFLLYWTNRDIGRARPYFDLAVAQRDNDYLGHLWYGNALIDAGAVEEGVEQLNHAMRIAPDSPAVLTDYAIARWQEGASQAALSLLIDVERRFPTHSAAPGAAALFYLTEGNVGEYLAHSERWAAIIGDSKQTERLAREQAAFSAGGPNGALSLIAESPALLSPFWHGGDLPAAIAASLIGDRVLLIRRLERVRRGRQNWRDLKFPADAFKRWRNDAQIGPLLKDIFRA